MNKYFFLCFAFFSYSYCLVKKITNLRQNFKIDSEQNKLVFSQDAILDGHNNSIIISIASGIVIGQAELTIQNCRVIVTDKKAIKSCNKSHLIFKDCEFVMGDCGFNFVSGDLSFRGKIYLKNLKYLTLTQPQRLDFELLLRDGYSPRDTIPKFFVSGSVGLLISSADIFNLGPRTAICIEENP